MAVRYYTPATYRSRNSIGYLIRQARNLITAGIEARFRQAHGDGGVSFVQWVILICLRDELATTPSEICHYISHDSGALTRLLDQMERRGLVKRSRSTSDRRVTQILLTDKGRKTAESLIGLVTDFYNEILIDFSPEEAETLVRLLGKFVTRLHEKKGAP